MLVLYFLSNIILLLNGGAMAQNPSVSSSKPVGKNVIVSMKSSVLPIINSVDKKDLSRDDLATLLTKRLKTFATTTQSPVITRLEDAGAEFQSYWITNQVFINNANPTLIDSLEDLKEVKSVEKEKLIKLDFVDVQFGKKPKEPEWHLKIMEVEKVWKKTKGEGIRVAIIDSGVRGTHEALKDNYIGSDKYGWHDPILFSKEPEDISGHGTHVMGILAGSGGIGVSPEAKWMACRAGLDLTLYEHAVIACAQFILCPSDSSNKTCAGVPHLVSNSWGENGGRTYFTQFVNAWVKVGIKTFFAAGNEGPDCKTVGSPADFDNVIAVGSTDKKDHLHESSSRGPVIRYERNANISGNKNVPVNGLFESISLIGQEPIQTSKIKPDIVAPGVDIYSSFSLSDKSYIQLTGTSMATPAAAGVAALLLSIKPKMTFKELKNLLYSTTDKDSLSNKDDDFLSSDPEKCGDIPDDKFPNNLYGHGRINAFKAYKKLEKKLKARKAAVKNKKELKS